jgi:hypothetical protein
MSSSDHLDDRAELTFAAVDQQQIRLLMEAIALRAACASIAAVAASPTGGRSASLRR